MHHLSFKFLVSVPIGHNVRTYRRERMFHGDWMSAGAASLVFDLDSGIIFGSDDDILRLRKGPGEPVYDGPSMRLVAELQGRVAWCMVHSSGGDTAEIETSIGLEPPSAPYR